MKEKIEKIGNNKYRRKCTFDVDYLIVGVIVLLVAVIVVVDILLY
jgi:hypothetical protein